MIEKMQEVVVTFGPFLLGFLFFSNCAYEYPFPNVFIHILFFSPSIKSYIIPSSLLHTFDPLFIINRGLSLREFR